MPYVFSLLESILARISKVFGNLEICSQIRRQTVWGKLFCTYFEKHAGKILKLRDHIIISPRLVMGRWFGPVRSGPVRSRPGRVGPEMLEIRYGRAGS